MPTNDSVGREAAAALSGLSVRQIRYWHDMGAIAPHAMGHVRPFRNDDGTYSAVLVEGEPPAKMVKGTRKPVPRSKFDLATMWSPSDVFKLTLVRQALATVHKSLHDGVVREAWALDTDTLDDLATLAVFTASTRLVCVRSITSETDHMLRVDSEWMLVFPLAPCWLAMAACEARGDG